jgi:hypothetical protein
MDYNNWVYLSRPPIVLSLLLNGVRALSGLPEIPKAPYSNYAAQLFVYISGT